MAHCFVVANHVRHQLPRQPLVRRGGLKGNQAPNRAQSILFAALCLDLGLQQHQKWVVLRSCSRTQPIGACLCRPRKQWPYGLWKPSHVLYIAGA